MWMEELQNGKFKYIERYKDPYTEKDKRVSITLNSKSNQAKKQAQKMLDEKIKSKLMTKENSNLTFEKALKDWLLFYEKTVKSSTFKMIESPIKIVRNYISDDVLLRNIDSYFIKDLIEKAYYTDSYSLSYVKKIKGVISSVLKRAYDTGKISAVPDYKLDLKLRNEPHVDKYLEPWELRAIIKQLNSNPKNERKADMVEFLAITGLRYGELIALTIDKFDGSSIKIDGTIDSRTKGYKQPIRTTPKTKKSNRVIPLSQRAIEILNKTIAENQFLKLNNDYVDSDYIFTSHKGLPIDFRTFTPALHIAAKNAGVSKPVTSHYLRHTHVSILAELNIPIKAVMDRLGHTDASTTLEVYTHVTEKMKTSLIKKLDDFKY